MEMMEQHQLCDNLLSLSINIKYIILQAELLRLGGSDVKIFYLELFDNNIGPRGAGALGSSLSYGNNLSLLTLKLDFNHSLGVEGETPLLHKTIW